MRILLIAYEFPPSPSPQSLRWAYLSGRLAARGHDVHVLTPRLGPPDPGLPEPALGVVIHRVYAGPLRALAQWLGRHVARSRQHVGNVDAAARPAWQPPRLNWKGQTLELLQRIVSTVVFPDQRGEWQPAATRALPGLLRTIRPDVVISSHEPATSLVIGLQAKQRGFRWIADLGDPVLTSYTARRWQRRAWELERRTLREADHILVTTDATRDLLASRHGRVSGIAVVPQGFDDLYAETAATIAPKQQEDPLDLLYSGAFYSFRDPTSLAEAVLATPATRLSIASGNVPDNITRLAQQHPDRLKLLGRVPHRQLLGMQREADLLVNIANQDPCQVPGKFYEYLGAGRPVLHLQGQGGDAVGELLVRLHRGWACQGDRDSIAEVLAEIRRTGVDEVGLDLSPAVVAEWSWTAAAARIERILDRIVVAPS